MCFFARRLCIKNQTILVKKLHALHELCTSVVQIQTIFVKKLSELCDYHPAKQQVNKPLGNSDNKLVEQIA